MKQEAMQDLFNRELSQSESYNESELKGNRVQAEKYYQGAPRGDELEGRSAIQSLDVADQVNAIWSQIQKAYTGMVVEFPPMSEEDEAQAQAESDYVKLEFDRNAGWTVLNESVFDALLKRNGWLKVWVEERTIENTETINTQDAAALGFALQPKVAGELVEVIDVDGARRTIKRTVTKRKLKIKAPNPKDMRFSSDCADPNLKGIRFIAEREYYTRSELLEMGYPKSVVMDLPASVELDDENTQTTPEASAGAQPELETIECWDAYLMLATKPGKEAMLTRGFIAATHLLEDEPVEMHPYCTGSVLPYPHRVAGQSMFDLLAMVQDSKTFTLRQWMDNLNNGNNNRVGVVEGEVNMDDILESKPNGVVRMLSAQSIFPFPFNDVGPSCQQALDYFDNIRTERGGAAVDLMRGEMQVAQSSALAAAGEFASKELMSEFYATNLVNSLIRSGFLLVHETMRRYMGGQMGFKRRGRWETTNPGDWPEREAVKVVAGLSNSGREERLAGLSQVIQSIMSMLQAGLGGIITDAGKLYAAQSDWIRTRNLGDPAEYLIDPDSEEARQTAKQKDEQQQKEKREVMAAQQAQLDRVEQLERWKTEVEYKYKYFDTQMDTQAKEAQISADAIEAAERQAIELTKVGVDAARPTNPGGGTGAN